MITIQGKGACGAIAIGRLSFFKRGEISVKRERVEDTKAELERFEAARQEAQSQLRALYDKALIEIGEANAQIFDIHQMMLEDLDYIDSVTNIIENQQMNAEYAVAVTADNFAMMFSSMDDEYMKERAADVKDVSNRVLRCFQQTADGTVLSGDGLIICADDLAPSETVQLDKSKVLAFVTQKGSLNSHTAILARTMNIPAVIGAGEALNPEFDGKPAVVDGYTGEVFIEPDADTLALLKLKQQEDEKKKALLQELKGKENITLDGRKINIFANIGGLSDIGAVLVNDAGGIGLFRSEFLYLENNNFPSEELQFATYKKVLESMAGKKVIIRTLDIGADKKIEYFDLDAEENPALGYRAIRICLTRQDIFKTQLRALYRASVFGNLSIMFPMIIAREEILEIKKIINEVKIELAAENVPFSDDVEIGIMIETPAAAVISDILAPEVDFFSVGTNDLTQYTLAIDRQNPKLDGFYDPHHESVLRLIQFAADSAHKNGKWIGICGELGADLSLTERFLKMGIDELSVSPSLVLSLRDKVRNSSCK
ncbi:MULTISPECIES: phosphoenolpyruvate--protein phosphotransferase [Congzhengia]|uniref:Phosphoenolpyruvate-protein phosphotransferase n=1 Tax=Congzhengia minquanensis TaxID=2763657 RepID=A0A926HZJ3_9FIRM|nr:phosphoenolpyruvate--protein phosphotransferase [Congzhengia minquanensis]MBC8541235.1 phosphoenolpyruvate--protein phosphotransferase [Congzhengia minquanensis]